MQHAACLNPARLLPALAGAQQQVGRIAVSPCFTANWCVKLALTCVCCHVVLLLWVHVCVRVTGVQPEELERHPSAAEAVEAYGLQDEQGAYRGPSAGELEWLGMRQQLQRFGCGCRSAC